MENSELIRKLMNTVSETLEDTKPNSEQVLNEGVHIELDGKEADDFVARLLTLSGHEMPAEVPMDMPADVPADMPAGIPIDAPADVDASLPVPHDMDLPVGHDMDMPADKDFDLPPAADHFVGETDDCVECGMPVESCLCDDMTLENADHDYGTDELEEEVGEEEVDPDTYMYQQVTPPQKMVKGTMGDNPLAEEAIARYSKIISEYNSFLEEAANEDGQASPLTAADRDEFDKDPHAGETPKDDGSMSPMSQVERQDIAK